MAILTTAECKALIDITATTWDTQIAAIIDRLPLLIFDACKTKFLSNYSGFLGWTSIAFVKGSGPTYDTITDSGDQFNDYYLRAGDVWIEGSYYGNNGLHTISSVADGTLTMSTIGTLNDEDIANSISIRQIEWPKELKLPVAQLIGHYIETGNNVTKESFSDSSRDLTAMSIWKDIRRCGKGLRYV